MMETAHARARNHYRLRRRLLLIDRRFGASFSSESWMQGRATSESRRQSEISALVNTLENTCPSKFSIRVFVPVMPSWGSRKVQLTQVGPVEAAVLYRFGQVLGAHVFGPAQIRDGAGHLQDPVVRSGA